MVGFRVGFGYCVVDWHMVGNRVFWLCVFLSRGRCVILWVVFDCLLV